MSNETSDLSAVLAENVALAAECESIKAEIAALESSLKTTRESNALLITENATLKTDNDKLKSDMCDFNKRVACEIVKHGISTTAVPLAQTLRRPSLDEEVAAAKGQPAK